VERVLVLGSSGSGKSTFAKQLGKKLGIDVIHLDSHYWQPDWTYTPENEWEQKIERLLEKESWIMDGNYMSTLSQRLEYADTVIFLDLNRVKCLWRCVSRYLKYQGENRPELAAGCNEKIDKDFLKWIWNYPREVRPRILKMLGDQPEIKMVVLRGTGDIDNFLAREDTDRPE
jgi:adenylate kinase family enzyme